MTPVSRTIIAVWLATLTLVPAAAAQDDGVIYDKDSPAGKEYALPLDSARDVGGGSGSGGGGGGTPGQAGGPATPPPAATANEGLFGTGVDAAPSASRDGEGSGTKRPEPTASGSTPQRTSSSSRISAITDIAPAAGPSSAAVGGLGAATAAALALLVAALIRRRATA